MADRLLKLVPCELGLDKEEDSLAVSTLLPGDSEKHVQGYWLDRCPKVSCGISSSSFERTEPELDFLLERKAATKQRYPTYQRASCHEMCAYSCLTVC